MLVKRKIKKDATRSHKLGFNELPKQPNFLIYKSQKWALLMVVMVGSSLSVVEEGVLKSLFLSKLKSLDYNAARHGAHTILLLINTFKMMVLFVRWGCLTERD